MDSNPGEKSEIENTQLQNLMSYTVFHIGAYITLLGIIIGFKDFSKLHICYIKMSFISFLIAGICGGTIASNIPEHSSFHSFSTKKIGIWGVGIFKYKTWVTIEHIAFWFGTLWIALQYIFRG